MSDATAPRFLFESKGLPKDTFHVVKFCGNEGLSSLYRFDITLISTQTDVDLSAVFKNPVEFTIKASDGDIPFKGVLSSFEQLHQSRGKVFYRARLVPTLWRTTLTHHNQFFLDQQPEEFLTAVLEDGGMRRGLHFDFKLKGEYPVREFVCQYNESHFNFISRWMERDGMYYYFEQTDKGEKMIITDSFIAHEPMSHASELTYSTPNNMDFTNREELVKSFNLKQHPLPRRVILKDYNYRKPSLEMKGEAEVSSDGFGDVHIYGEHFRTEEEGNKLAATRAEELRCRGQVYHGVSSVPYLRTGYIFTMKDHYRNGFNQRYMTIEAMHEGAQEAFLVSGLKLRVSKHADRLLYRNSFSCIPADVQFRAECKATKPRFTGSMNAKIDASGSGKYAELDEQGRYKVVLPMDNSGRKDGKASTWLRMAQPYGGSDHGMHFPLRKGTEVLLTCIDGDPDRPIIQSTVPNPETPSLVNDKNQTTNMITTGGQNKIHIDDTEGSEGIVMQTPKNNSRVSIGLPDITPPTYPPGYDDAMKKKGLDSLPNFKSEDGETSLTLSSSGILGVTAAVSQKVTLGNSFSFVGGGKESVFMGDSYDLFVGRKVAVSLAVKEELSLGATFAYSIAPKLYVDLIKSTEFNWKLQKVVKEKTALEKDLVALRENVKKLEENEQAFRMQSETLQKQKTELTQTKKALAQESSRLTETIEEFTKKATKMEWQISVLRKKALYASDNVVNILNDGTTVAEKENRITNTSTKMSNNEQKIGTSSSEIFANKKVI